MSGLMLVSNVIHTVNTVRFQTDVGAGPKIMCKESLSRCTLYYAQLLHRNIE